MFHFLFLGNVEKWNKEVDMKKSFMSFEPLGHTNKKVLFFSVNTKFFTFFKKNKQICFNMQKWNYESYDTCCLMWDCKDTWALEHKQMRKYTY